MFFHFAFKRFAQTFEIFSSSAWDVPGAVEANNEKLENIF